MPDHDGVVGPTNASPRARRAARLHHPAAEGEVPLPVHVCAVVDALLRGDHKDRVGVVLLIDVGLEVVGEPVVGVVRRPVVQGRSCSVEGRRVRPTADQRLNPGIVVVSHPVELPVRGGVVVVETARVPGRVGGPVS